MTRAFLPLFTNNLRVMFGLSKDYKEKRKQIMIYVALCVLVLPMLVLLSVGVYYIAKNSDIVMLTSLISSIMFASEIIVLFFGVMSALSLLFSSKDTEMLLALPATGIDIFVSKFVTLYLVHLGLALLIQLPVILVLGIGASIKSVAYYTIGFIGSLLTPFIPLFIIAIIAVPLGYVVSYFKRNNIVGTIVVLLLFGGFFAGYYYLIFAIQGTATDGNINMESMKVAMDIMSYIVYPNTFIATSMLTTGVESLKNFGIFFAIIAGLAIISIGLSAVLYKRSARSGLETSVKKNSKKKENEIVSVDKSLIARDFKSCMGETASAFNYLLGLVLAPIVMVMLSVVYGQGAYPKGVVSSCASIIATMFSCGMNYFAIVAFSREGRQMDVLRMLPVANRKIINQKIGLAMCYTFVINLILIISMIIARLHYITIIMLTVIVILGGLATNVLCIYYDLKNPNFTWNNTKELFKNNSKTLMAMLFGLPLVLVSFVGSLISSVVFADYFKNDIISNIVGLVPALLLAIIYVGVALQVYYPKLDKLYECLEI